jgi:hypothetical protein
MVPTNLRFTMYFCVVIRCQNSCKRTKADVITFTDGIGNITSGILLGILLREYYLGNITF